MRFIFLFSFYVTAETSGHLTVNLNQLRALSFPEYKWRTSLYGSLIWTVSETATYDTYLFLHTGKCTSACNVFNNGLQKTLKVNETRPWDFLVHPIFVQQNIVTLTATTVNQKERLPVNAQNTVNKVSNFFFKNKVSVTISSVVQQGIFQDLMQTV